MTRNLLAALGKLYSLHRLQKKVGLNFTAATSSCSVLRSRHHTGDWFLPMSCSSLLRLLQRVLQWFTHTNVLIAKAVQGCCVMIAAARRGGLATGGAACRASGWAAGGTAALERVLTDRSRPIWAPCPYCRPGACVQCHAQSPCTVHHRAAGRPGVHCQVVHGDCLNAQACIFLPAILGRPQKSNSMLEGSHLCVLP